jgi:hypothetical protein
MDQLLLTLQGINVQRHSFGGFESEPDGLLLALGSTDAAAHAFFKIYTGLAVYQLDCIKLAEFYARFAADAEFVVHL